jgi:glycosyltransferase involved in cell wall biosynthesis
MHICMVVFGDLRFDFRVFREATALRQAGHRVSLVASSFATGPLPGWEAFPVRTIPVDRSRSLRRIYPRFWQRAWRILAELRADAYHAHDLDALWPAAKAARRWGVPLVYDSHELWTGQSSLVGRPLVRGVWAALERRLVRNVDRTIAVSPGVAHILKDRYRLEHVLVVRNLPPYRPPVPGDRIRAELGLAAGRPVVLYQGGFLTENGLSEQIEAVAGLDGPAFVLIGSGPTEDALRNQVLRNGLRDKVYFLPRVPFAELHSYTCSADVGLCLIKGVGMSFYLSLPNKLFEYMMAGLPVLASDFPEMRAVVDDTRAGQLVDPQDGPAVREHLHHLLTDREQQQAFRRAALEAAQRYCWEREAPALVNLYAGL